MTDDQVKQAEWTSENATNDKKVRRHQLAFFIKALLSDRRELVAECDRLRASSTVPDDCVVMLKSALDALCGTLKNLQLEASVWRRLCESVERHETQLADAVTHAARYGNFAAADRLLREAGYEE